jgi:putative CRISPR-associated protein (TIGR02619 family)
MTMHLIVSTCGTSLLTNGAPPDLQKWLTECTNQRENELSLADKDRILKQLEQKTQELDRAHLDQVRKLSADLNGIISFYGGQFPAGSPDQHILLHTDTFQGRIAAETLRDWLVKRKVRATCQVAEGLTTRSIQDFNAGISSVIAWCEKTLPGYKGSYRIVFNLVGGFKLLQGYMQTLGMLYAHEMIYIFETNNELLRIPRLPIELERSVEAAVRTHIKTFRRLARPDDTISRPEAADIPETFIYEWDGRVELSPWGKLVWERLRRSLYGERIWEVWSSSVRLSAKALRAAEGLPEDLRATYNERMDDLAVYVESTRVSPSPKRLDLKTLKGNPCPPSTHEFDISADRGAWRGFGHYEGKTFVVDTINPHS